MIRDEAATITKELELILTPEQVQQLIDKM